jgi:hypothetical protein
VIDPRCTVVSDSRCLGVSPAQEQTALADREPFDDAELSTEDGSENRADTIELLDYLIPVMPFDSSAMRTSSLLSRCRRS